MRINRAQNPLGQRNVYSSGFVPELAKININHCPGPAAECALLLQACQARGLGDRLLIIQQSLKMQQDGFLGVAERLFQRIARREAAGEIRDHHSVGVPLVADLNGNRIPHIESSLNARLLADLFHQANTEVFLRVWHRRSARIGRMPILVVAATNAIELPPSGFQQPNQLSALHRVYNTHLPRSRQNQT
jgi:hypothetical protein